MTTETERQAYIDELLTRLGGLVRARELRECHDANNPAFRTAEVQIEELHWQLARIVQADQRLQHAA